MFVLGYEILGALHARAYQRHDRLGVGVQHGADVNGAPALEHDLIAQVIAQLVEVEAEVDRTYERRVRRQKRKLIAEAVAWKTGARVLRLVVVRRFRDHEQEEFQNVRHAVFDVVDGFDFVEVLARPSQHLQEVHVRPRFGRRFLLEIIGRRHVCVQSIERIIFVVR